MRSAASRTGLHLAGELRRYTRAYPALIKIAMLNNIQYRASGMIWMIGSVLEPLIFLVVWSTVARSSGGQAGGYTAREFAAYYIVLMMINHLTFSWIMHIFQYRVQYGELSMQLVRPIHPIHEDVADNIAYKIVQMIIMLPALIILTLLFDPDFDFELLRIIIVVPIIGLAAATRFFLEWSLGMVAFWATRVTAINQTYFAVMMFFSGRIAPLALMPEVIQNMAGLLPFYYLIAFPVEVLIGKLPLDDVAPLALALCGWLVLSLWLIARIWRLSVKHYSAVGG